MPTDPTAAQIIEREMADTERSLTAIGKFGVLMIAIAMLALVVLLYKIGTLVSPLNRAELKLVVACVGLLAFAVLAGAQFLRVAEYRKAIRDWQEQTRRDYDERHKL